MFVLFIYPNRIGAFYTTLLLTNLIADLYLNQLHPHQCNL